MRLNPLRDLVLVRRNCPKATTPGGLLIPASALTDQYQGVVVAVGPGPLKRGRLQPMRVKPGEHVLFCSYAGADVNINGKDCVILRQNDIIAVIGQ